MRNPERRKHDSCSLLPQKGRRNRFPLHTAAQNEEKMPPRVRNVSRMTATGMNSRANTLVRLRGQSEPAPYFVREGGRVY